MRILSLLPVLWMLGCSGPAQHVSTPESAPPPWAPGTEDPLDGCTKGPPGPATNWNCGPHLVVRAVFPDKLPPGADKVPRMLGDTQVMETRLDHEDGPLLLTIVGRDQAHKAVVSCRLHIDDRTQESAMRTWCDTVVQTLISDL